jgi:hypothetical protein
MLTVADTHIIIVDKRYTHVASIKFPLTKQSLVRLNHLKCDEV